MVGCVDDIAAVLTKWVRLRDGWKKIKDAGGKEIKKYKLMVVWKRVESWKIIKI